MARLPSLQGTNFLKFGTSNLVPSVTALLGPSHIVVALGEPIVRSGFAPIGLRVNAPADGVADTSRSSGQPGALRQ